MKFLIPVSFTRPEQDISPPVISVKFFSTSFISSFSAGFESCSEPCWRVVFVLFLKYCGNLITLISVTSASLHRVSVSHKEQRIQ